MPKRSDNANPKKLYINQRRVRGRLVGVRPPKESFKFACSLLNQYGDVNNVKIIQPFAPSKEEAYIAKVVGKLTGENTTAANILTMNLSSFGLNVLKPESVSTAFNNERAQELIYENGCFMSWEMGRLRLLGISPVIDPRERSDPLIMESYEFKSPDVAKLTTACYRQRFPRSECEGIKTILGLDKIKKWTADQVSFFQAISSVRTEEKDMSDEEFENEMSKINASVDRMKEIMNEMDHKNREELELEMCEIVNERVKKLLWMLRSRLDCGRVYNVVRAVAWILREKLNFVPHKMTNDEYDLLFQMCLGVATTNFIEFAFSPGTQTKQADGETLFNIFDDIFISSVYLGRLLIDRHEDIDSAHRLLNEYVIPMKKFADAALSKYEEYLSDDYDLMPNIETLKQMLGLVKHGKVCHCNRYQFGDMLQCDCGKWFHYECVNLISSHGQPDHDEHFKVNGLGCVEDWTCKECANPSNMNIDEVETSINTPNAMDESPPPPSPPPRALPIRKRRRSPETEEPQPRKRRKISDSIEERKAQSDSENVPEEVADFDEDILMEDIQFPMEHCPPSFETRRSAEFDAWYRETFESEMKDESTAAKYRGFLNTLHDIGLDDAWFFVRCFRHPIVMNSDWFQLNVCEILEKKVGMNSEETKKFRRAMDGWKECGSGGWKEVSRMDGVARWMREVVGLDRFEEKMVEALGTRFAENSWFWQKSSGELKKLILNCGTKKYGHLVRLWWHLMARTERSRRLRKVVEPTQ